MHLFCFGNGSVIVDLLLLSLFDVFIWSLFCCAVFRVISSVAIISLRLRELVALLELYS